MLAIFSRLFGPARAVSLYLFIRQWWLGFAFVGLMGLILALLFAGSAGEPHHVAYFKTEVVSVEPLNVDVKNGVFVNLRLPDGKELQLTETEGLIAGSITDSACLEQLESPESGAVSYRLRRPERCEN